MSKVVLSLGFFLMLLFIMGVYLGYTVVITAADTITTHVQHVIASEVMVPANSPHGGGYVTEGVGGVGLNLDLPTLTAGVNYQLAQEWQGGQAQENSVQAITWFLPSGVNRGYHITGPVSISRITESTSLPPVLTAQVAIPIAVNVWLGSWTGILHRTVVLPLAGQQFTNDFVGYSQAWFNAYQSGWTTPAQGLYTADSYVTGPAIGPGSTPNANVPEVVWFASQQATAPVAGNYTLTVAADDGAAIWINGRLVASPYLAQSRFITALVPLSVGPVIISAEVTNNGQGSLSIVPYNKQLANPSMLSLTLTAPNGQVIASTDSASGWTIDAYPKISTWPAGGQMWGTLP